MSLPSIKDILATIDDLASLYDGAANNPNSNVQLYYSKLAVLELSGWVENTVDYLILSHSRNAGLNDANSKLIDTIVEKNYAMDYHSCLRAMLISLIGVIKVEELERRIQVKYRSVDILKSKLGDVKKLRDEFAHTHLNYNLNNPPAMRLFYTPSVIKKLYLEEIAQFLIAFENELASL